MAFADFEATELRRFNRLYTQAFHLLEENFLGSDFALPSARVLYEIAAQPGATARDLGIRLNLDGGYVSRILAQLERRGLISRTILARDRRSSELHLTEAGRVAFEQLDAKSQEQARQALNRMNPGQRSDFLDGIRNVTAGLLPVEEARRPAYVLREPRAGDMGWIIMSEGEYYARELGWSTQTEAFIARVVVEFIESSDQARERCWIAEMDGSRVGHVLLMQDRTERETARLRMLFVDSSARGSGLGTALVNECIVFARGARYARIRLWTQSVLEGALRIYLRAGFRLVSEEAHRLLGPELIGQIYELEL